MKFAAIGFGLWIVAQAVGGMELGNSFEKTQNARAAQIERAIDAAK